MSMSIKAKAHENGHGIAISYRLNPTCPERVIYLGLSQARQLYLDLDAAVEDVIKGTPR